MDRKDGDFYSGWVGIVTFWCTWVPSGLISPVWQKKLRFPHITKKNCKKIPQKNLIFKRKIWDFYRCKRFEFSRQINFSMLFKPCQICLRWIFAPWDIPFCCLCNKSLENQGPLMSVHCYWFLEPEIDTNISRFLMMKETLSLKVDEQFSRGKRSLLKIEHLSTYKSEKLNSIMIVTHLSLPFWGWCLMSDVVN